MILQLRSFLLRLDINVSPDDNAFCRVLASLTVASSGFVAVAVTSQFLSQQRGMPNDLDAKSNRLLAYSVYLKTFPFLKKNLCKIDRFLPRDDMRKRAVFAAARSV